MTSKTSALSLATCLLLLGGLTACGDGDDTATSPSPSPTPTVSESTTPTPSPTPSPSPSPQGTVIDATIRGNDLEPNGKRVKAKVGEDITINIDADRAGELHVHSTPEQQLKYAAGKSTLHLVIKTPGIVEVEDHVAEKVLVSLEVS